jgi:hypothetical protein
MASASGAAAVDCANQDFHTLRMEQNLRASQILVQCGKAPGGGPAQYSNANPFQLGGTDINLITGTETLPHVIQSESMSAVNGNTVVVNYNDSSGLPTGVNGISVSNDGGATFSRILPAPLNTGHGSNSGDPIIVYNQKFGKFVAGDLVSGCGGAGIGIWSSTDGVTWPAGVCPHSGSADDRESMAVDNDPTSAFYGDMYISWNDFNVGAGAIRVTHSTDGGATWTAPVNLTAGFVRNAQVTVGPTVGPGGTVYVAAENENGGGFPKAGAQNLMFHSTDGGATWNSAVQATIPGTFSLAGDSTCSSNPYFPKITPIWRETGYGVPAAGPSNVVMYDYAAHGAGADPGDIFLERSTDGGITWAPTPVKLNTDATTRAQWMPSLAVTSSGRVVATWYDRRNTATDDYQRFARVSNDNGATWGADEPISDQVIPQPNQADPSIQACYAGDYNYPTAGGNTVFDTWTDGRVSISPNGPQQDVFLERIKTLGPGATTLAASGIGVHTATLNGLANDNSKAGTAQFEYGTTTAYGRTTPVVNLGASASDQPLSQAIGGLAPNTTYHFRLNATNPDDTANGADRTLTTPPLAFHRITIDKSGIGSGSVAAADGQINCGPTCTHVYQDEDTVTLTPTPHKGSAFHGWSGGGCTGTGPCTFSVSANTNIDAIFLPSSAFRFGKPILNKVKGTAVLPAVFPDSGTASLRGQGIKPIHKRSPEKRVRHAGTFKLKIRPKGKAKKQLLKKGKAKVKAKVTFKVTGGDPLTKTKKLKLVRHR